MKVLLEIKDNKAVHLMEILKSLPFVKATPVSDEKTQLIEEIKEAVRQLNLVKQGKLKGTPVEELLDEL